MMECGNCEKKISIADDHYLVEHTTSAVYGTDTFDYWLCSPSCLVEWAWKVKDSQKKLSKSNLGLTENG